MIKVKKKTKQTKVVATFESVTKKYLDFRRSVGKIEDAQVEAFDNMFELGIELLDIESKVKEVYGNWGLFAEDKGLDRFVLSRCRASVADFRSHGVNTLDEARALLKKKGLKPTAKLLESNINRLLTDVDYSGQKERPKDNSVKKQKHIDELRNSASRAEEIMDQHEADDEIYGEAQHISTFLNESIQYLESLDVSQKNWNSELYLQFCRNINYDVVLGEPVEKSEPHHIGPNGDYGSQGGKVADFFAIPVSRDTHNKLHGNKIELTYEEIADMHRWTMAMFLINTISSDA